MLLKSLWTQSINSKINVIHYFMLGQYVEAKKSLCSDTRAKTFYKGFTFVTSLFGRGKLIFHPNYSFIPWSEAQWGWKDFHSLPQGLNETHIENSCGWEDAGGSRSVSANLQLEGHTLYAVCHMELQGENLTHTPQNQTVMFYCHWRQ